MDQRRLPVDLPSDQAFSGVLKQKRANALSLVKTGPGTQTLSGVNTYSGGTTLEQGALAVSNDNNLGAPVGGITFNGGTLQAMSTFSSPRAMEVQQTGGTIEVPSAPDILTLNGTLSGAGGITKSGPGTLMFSGVNKTYLGMTKVSTGNLGAAGDGAFCSSSVHDVDVGAVLDLNNTNQTIAGLTGAGTVITTNGPGTLVVDMKNDYVFTDL